MRHALRKAARARRTAGSAWQGVVRTPDERLERIPIESNRDAL